ncbi:MAG: tetrathionate reductase family octaheme c-type cytochrome [Fibrobacterales bacterium]
MRPQILLAILIPLAIVIGGILYSLTPREVSFDNPQRFISPKKPHVDHKDLITGDFKDGPSVTRKCLTCHKDAAKEHMKTTHWKWTTDSIAVPWHDTKIMVGKKHSFNNFCIGIAGGNESKCTKCHTGYGWADKNFDFTAEERVDCLVCHDGSGLYAKAGKGLPNKSVNLTEVAKSVGFSSRKNCGSCHFSGGGGNAVKHGDLDESLYFPTPRIDIHMGKLDFQCTTCHETENHNITGRSMSVSVTNDNRLDCTKCHNENPHKDTRINLHTKRVACQTCHIPEVAIKTPTKTDWDWSKAGQEGRKEDVHHYMKMKGEFIYKKNLKPEYHWYNGTSKVYITGQKVDSTKGVAINEPLGSIKDSTSKIWPFKVHRGKQIYDNINNYLIQPKTVGGYWEHFDWQKALTAGAKNMGIEYSGSYGFTQTEMYWPLSHMVAESNRALSCMQCHGDDGRMDWKALGYTGDPMTTIGGN